MLNISAASAAVVCCLHPVSLVSVFSLSELVNPEIILTCRHLNSYATCYGAKIIYNAWK